jgi:hypothetical protein
MEVLDLTSNVDVIPRELRREHKQLSSLATRAQNPSGSASKPSREVLNELSSGVQNGPGAARSCKKKKIRMKIPMENRNRGKLLTPDVFQPNCFLTRSAMNHAPELRGFIF